MTPTVSIVVPVHDPGPDFEPCLGSLLAVDFPRDDLELLFVDDGSSDGTEDRLDALALEHPQVRVIHLPASGGPGRPRNVGIAEARGEFLQFIDDDDEILPGAISSLLATARRSGSDIVLGKFASASLPRRQDLFVRSRDRLTFRSDLEIADGSYGPCRFFRTAFLREQALAFPEGWRHMEDQVFMLRAFLAARTISVFADEPCYRFRRRPGEDNLTVQRPAPAVHAAHLDVAFRTATEAIPAGPLRDRVIRRFVRLEVLEPLADQAFFESGPADRAALVDALAAVVREHLGEGPGPALGAIADVRLSLLREGRVSALETLARREAQIGLVAAIEDARWRRGRLVGRWRAGLVRGEPPTRLRHVVRGGRRWLDPWIAEDLIGPVEVTRDAAAIRGQVVVIEEGTSLEWILETSPGADVGGSYPELRGRLDLDPERVGPAGRPLGEGTWGLVVRWTGLGMRRTAGLVVPDGTSAPGPAGLGRAGLAVIPRLGPHGGLGLVVDRSGTTLTGLPDGAIHRPGPVWTPGRLIDRAQAAIARRAYGLPAPVRRALRRAYGWLRR